MLKPAFRLQKSGAGSTAVRAAALYVACTVLLAYPLAFNPRSAAMPGDPDTDLFMWTLAWNTHALTTSPWSVFDANIYHPNRLTLAFSENLLGSTLFAAPVLWTTGDPLLALNFTALASIVLSALGAFVLGRRLGMSTAAAVLCGMAFAFSQARFFRLGQLHLTTIQWIPFCLAYLHAYLDEGRRRDLRIAVGFFTLQALTSGHAAAFLTMAVVVLLAYSLMRGVTPSPIRRLRDLGIPGGLLLLPTVLVFVPYRMLQKELGLVRSLADWETPPQSFLASVSPLHTKIFSWFSRTDFAEGASAYLFPGFVVLLLAAVSLAVVRHRPSAAFYLVLTVVSVLLSAGPPLGLWPNVHEWPGLNFIRVPSRFMLLGVLSLAVLAGVGFDALTTRSTRRLRAVAAALAGILIVAECLTIPLPAYRPYTVEIPAADRWVATQPDAVAVAEAPANRWNERLQSTYMLHSTAHWRKTVHGHSGFRTPQHVELYSRMRTFPDDASLRSLASFGVTHVVVHPAFYDEADWPVVDAALSAAPLQLVFDDGDARVYRLSPR